MAYIIRLKLMLHRHDVLLPLPPPHTHTQTHHIHTNALTHALTHKRTYTYEQVSNSRSNTAGGCLFHLKNVTDQLVATGNQSVLDLFAECIPVLLQEVVGSVPHLVEQTLECESIAED